jgi:uncharacterized protein with HEPN domain
MPRDYLLYLEDILEASKRIEDYISGVEFQDFIADSMRVDAVLHNFTVLGEAVRSVPPDVRDLYPSIEWQGIVRVRNIVTHAYFGVSLDIIWDIIKNELPQLRDAVKAILSGEDIVAENTDG